MRTLSINLTLRHHTHGFPSSTTHLSLLPTQSSSPSSPAPSCSSGTTIGSSCPGNVRKWKQRRDTIRPSSFPRVCHLVRGGRVIVFLTSPTLPCFPLNPTASTLVEKMLKYFFASLMPAFRHLRRATTSSLASVAPRRPQPALPLYRPPGFREPSLATPRPAMPRDSSSFRVQSNPYSDSEPSMTTLPVSSSPSIPTFPGPAGSPPS